MGVLPGGGGLGRELGELVIPSPETCHSLDTTLLDEAERVREFFEQRKRRRCSDHCQVAWLNVHFFILIEERVSEGSTE